MFYELLTLNIPTIFFCDEKFWKLSKKCKNDFNILKKVNIYFNSINELIHFLNNSNKNKINQWWFKKETQNVKNDFLKIYGLSNKGYLDEWTNIITTNYN